MKRILMIATGGTIASMKSEEGLTPGMSGEELAANVPGLDELCELDVIQLMNIDSTNMRPKHWVMIRDAIMEKLNVVPGVCARPTEGGSYLFVEIPELDVTLHQFIRIVREMANVIVTPGTEFGPQFVHHFRINFSQDKEKAVAAIERLLAIMERYRKA